MLVFWKRGKKYWFFVFLILDVEDWGVCAHCAYALWVQLINKLCQTWPLSLFVLVTAYLCHRHAGAPTCRTPGWTIHRNGSSLQEVPLVGRHQCGVWKNIKLQWTFLFNQSHLQCTNPVIFLILLWPNGISKHQEYALLHVLFCSFVFSYYGEFNKCLDLIIFISHKCFKEQQSFLLNLKNYTKFLSLAE